MVLCERCSVSLVVLDQSVDPHGYYELPYRNKPSVARAIGALNSNYRETGATVMLLVPGRIGTSSPELGVPVYFAEISHMRMIFEIAYSEAGYQPELSWGSHIFQDLVESKIFYGEIPEAAIRANASAPKNGESVCRTGFFAGEEDLFSRLAPDSVLPPGLVSVYELRNLVFLSDVMNRSASAYAETASSVCHDHLCAPVLQYCIQISATAFQ